jgi:septum site-determining protein MinC
MMPDFSDTFPSNVADSASGDIPSDAPNDFFGKGSGDVPGDGFGQDSGDLDDNGPELPPEIPEPAEISGIPEIPDRATALPPLDYAQTYLKSDGVRLWLALPPETNAEGDPISWTAVLQYLRQRLEGTTADREPQTEVYLQGGDRLLDVRQLQTLAETLAEFALVLKRVVSSRRQTALAAVTAGYSVDQVAAVDHLVQTPPQAGRPQADPLYLQTTVRSGVDIRHPGTIVILGDTNPGSALLADGDVIVWGRLRGMAHAGFSGDCGPPSLGLLT